VKDARGDGEEVSYNRRIVDSRSVRVPRPPAEAFRPILRIGGDNGWYYANWLWWLRGFFDWLERHRYKLGVRVVNLCELIANALNIRRWVPWWRGDLARDRTLLEEAVAYAREHGVKSALAEGLGRLGNGKAEALGAGARKRIMRDFSLESVADRYMRLYREMLGR